MKKKVISVVIDIVLLVGVLALVDFLALKVFQTESIWLDIGLYIVLYLVVFGIKSGIVALWKRRKKNVSADKEEESKQEI